MLAGLRFGNVIVMIQPPRGFGENPVAIYHDPDLPPSHHYLAAYRWLETTFGADAVVHLGKHGTLEWLPGKGLGLSADCAPDAVLGNLPLVYPFIVNDPGEGTQAKRRGHATIIDHLIPPMARADTYGDLAKLEQLLDEYATVSALDPVKLPVLRTQIWELIQAAELHHDLELAAAPGEDEFDSFVLHVDGYLCEVKDALIRDGLHILGRAPDGEQRAATVLAVLRATQVWGGRTAALPGLRSALAGWAGLDEEILRNENPSGPVTVPAALTRVADGPARTAGDVVDLLESAAHQLVTTLDDLGWPPDQAALVCTKVLGEAPGDVVAVLEFAATGGGAAAGPDHRRGDPPAARAGRPVRPGRAVRVAHPRAGQRAAHRPQLLLRGPEGHPVPQRLGDRGRAGRLAAGPAPGRHRELPPRGRADGLGHVGHAHPGR